MPAGGAWVFEPKYDGIRILAFAADDRVRLVSRNGLDKTRQFPEVAEAVLARSKRAKRQFIVDGEIVVMRGDTPARFQELQISHARHRRGRDRDASRRHAGGADPVRHPARRQDIARH